MKKIATHNSATGEKGKGLLSWFLTPFARCQGRTIRQQYDAGCRYFDIRVRPDRGGVWRCTHGPWKSRRIIREVLAELETLHLPQASRDDVWVVITYEGEYARPEEFKNQVFSWMSQCAPHVNLAAVSMKKPTWTALYNHPNAPASRHGFIELDFSTWHTWFPVPWFWSLFRKKEFDETVFTFVDFL